MLKGLCLLALVAAAVHWGPDLLASGSDGSSGGGVACPTDVANALPGGGTGATLRAAYETDRFLITVCHASDGQDYYDGQAKNEAPSSDSHITLRATATADGYVAHNGPYTYQIHGQRITVTKAGKTLLDDELRAQA